jgi:hypothetical protein
MRPAKILSCHLTLPAYALQHTTQPRFFGSHLQEVRTPHYYERLPKVPKKQGRGLLLAMKALE